MKKSELDKFYTNPELANRLVKTIKNTYDLWVEPSAGSGSFLNSLPTPRIGIDIEPEAEDILCMNFFDWAPPPNTAIAVVGNPPFGVQSKLAIEFFNYAAKWASLIAFVVPRTFKKVSIQNRLSMNWVLTYEELLPKDSFLLVDSGVSKVYDVPCMWQIWEPGKRQKITLKTSHPDWTWSSHDTATYAMRRVGGLAGKCFNKDWEHYSPQSHYYFNCSEEIYNRLNSLYVYFQEVSKYTVGSPSIGKGEIVNIYNKYFAAVA